MSKPSNPPVIDKRIAQMRATARNRRKSVPSVSELRALFAALDDGRCPECGVVMRLSGVGGETVTLQHDRSGAFRLLCRRCNTRHASFPGDSFYDRDDTKRRCPDCEQIKPLQDFAVDRRNCSVVKRKTYCRPCSAARLLSWQRTNRDYYNARQREYRARRKAAGNPVRGGW